MKTFADLKIDDTVFYIDGYEVKQTKVVSLAGRNSAVKTDKYDSKTDQWGAIKGLTKCEGDYSFATIYCNQSEAIMDLKLKIASSIDEKYKELQKNFEQFIDLKNEIFKYL